MISILRAVRNERTFKVLLCSILLAASRSFGSHLAPREKFHAGRSRMKESNEANDVTFTVQTWNPLRLLVLRLGLTEPMGASPLNYGTYNGEFTCAFCGNNLFDSTSKYDSSSGWPSFWRSASDDSVAYKMEFDGRLECRCKRCSR
jgi:peptide methionine sulfoxide reductase MsrB